MLGPRTGVVAAVVEPLADEQTSRNGRSRRERRAWTGVDSTRNSSSSSSSKEHQLHQQQRAKATAAAAAPAVPAAAAPAPGTGAGRVGGQPQGKEEGAGKVSTEREGRKVKKPPSPILVSCG